MRCGAVAAGVGTALLVLALSSRGYGDGALPYRLWWSFPADDETAIEIDEPDLSVSKWDSRWRFAIAMQPCDARRSRRLAGHPDGTPVREIRVDAIAPGGQVRDSRRCVMTLADWRARLGVSLVERLDDELDAHAAFLLPRRRPGMPAKVTPDGASPR